MPRCSPLLVIRLCSAYSFAMKSIAQDLKFKQAAITYSFKYGVTKAAIQYKKTRQWMYYWRKRYIPGDIHSLQEKSRKPHSHPNAHKNTEILLIENMRRRNPDEGLTMFWIKLQKRGYTRCITSLYRVMQKLGYYNYFNKAITAAANLPAFRGKHTAFLNIITGWESM